MTDVALLLGPIAFRDFEVPSGVNFGGRQRLAMHRLPGGARVIDALGRDDAQIAFSGVFSGPDATLRARSLDELRILGAALPLTWDVFYYTVLVSEFHADYRGGCWIPYRIACTVLQDEATALLQPLLSLAAAALGDVGTAAVYALDAGIDLAPVQAALAAPDATTRGTAAYVGAQSALAGATSGIASAMATANGRLTASDPASATTAGAGVVGLLGAVAASAQLTSLTTANAYVSRASLNLANAST